MTDQPPVPNILVVDDTPDNLHLLTRLLAEHGYRPRPVTSGEQALETAAASPPDLVLLDINMPGLNGYAVCERLKADPRLKDVPVIFVSATGETINKVKAFACGGVDYLTKPFDFAEVEARVNTHLRLRRLQLVLQQSYEQLRELEALRDSLVHMMVHDLRSPLTVIDGYLQLLTVIGTLTEQQGGYVALAREASHELIEMVSALLDVSKLEAGKLAVVPGTVDLCGLGREALVGFTALIAQGQHRVQAPSGTVTVACDRGLILRVLRNLLSNALAYTPDQGQVRLDVTAAGEYAKVVVADTGPGIPPEYHERIFEKFGQVQLREHKKLYSTGLGLTFCKLVVEAHGGQIGVISAPGQGSTFWFTLPIAGPPAAAADQ